MFLCRKGAISGYRVANRTWAKDCRVSVKEKWLFKGSGHKDMTFANLTYDKKLRADYLDQCASGLGDRQRKLAETKGRGVFIERKGVRPRQRKPHSTPRGDKPCPTAYRPC